jgi:hypothetical protein
VVDCLTKIVGLGLIVGLGCGGDDGGGTGSSMSSAGTETNTGPMSQSETNEGSGEGSSTGYVEPGCGNGVIDSDEECDDGDANSDTEPDACRTDCELPTCRDEVVDSGEECDEGLENSDFEPDTCRYECMLPSCGDDVTDNGERCDDANEQFGDTCFRCSDRWYFILNGNGSIIRTTRDGPAEQIVGTDYAGLQGIALLPMGARVCAVQSMGGMDRVLFFDPANGELVKEVDIGMGAVGFDPDAQAIALGSDGNLHVAATGSGSVQIITVDPGTDDVSAASLGSSFEIADMTADDQGSLYISTGSGGGIERVEISTMTASSFATGLGNPSGINYQVQNQLVWVVSQTGGPVDVLNVSLAGAVTGYTTSKTGLGSETPALLIDVGDVVAVAAPEQNRIAAIALLMNVSDLFTDMTMAPIDIELVVLPGDG